jgi:hypothetical protein
MIAMSIMTTIASQPTAAPSSARSRALTPAPPESAAPPATHANLLGFWTALLTSVCALAALAVGITTPPRSGPNCLADCITYPYTDAAAFVPRDYLWMYPAALLAGLFVVLVTCIHHAAPQAQRVFCLPHALWFLRSTHHAFAVGWST